MPDRKEIPFQPYEGDEPYIFVSYAHADSEQVFPIVKRLHELGYRIWYDEGIDPGSEWYASIAVHLKNASQMLLFVTPVSVDRTFVRREINFASRKGIPILPIILEDFDIPDEIDFQLCVYQYMPYFTPEDRFLHKLCVGLPVQTKEIKLIREPSSVTETQTAPVKPVMIVPDRQELLRGFAVAIRKVAEKRTRDSPAQAAEVMTELQEPNDVPEQISIPITKPFHPGSTVAFGPFDWRVLAAENGKALLLSEAVVATKAFDTGKRKSDASYEESSIRKWLNTSFLRMLPDTERMPSGRRISIAETEMECNGRIFKDKVFLLSYEEVLANLPTNYLRIAYTIEKKKRTGTGTWWWLRTPGSNPNSFANVIATGAVDRYGSGVSNTGGVRPALWLNLNAIVRH
ncbi:MAG: toll/interleukin-1 receptor domain-containing protein [Oscillospiraceae bacterium]|jgi:hypothetical protein|nr:toll/interleukin-1 receptor domain-containing protein [Oscillospiraceae bacterium]